MEQVNNENEKSYEIYEKPPQEKDDIANNKVDENEEPQDQNEEHNESEMELPQVHEKRGNFIFRQELSSFTPECNAKNALCCNFFMMIMFAGVGKRISNRSFLE